MSDLRPRAGERATARASQRASNRASSRASKPTSSRAPKPASNRPSNRASWRFCLGRVLVPLLATATAFAALWPIYQTGEFLVLGLIVLLAGAVLVVLGARFDWPAYAILGGAAALYLLLGVPLAIPSAAVGGILPSGPGFLQLLEATALSWRQLVTIVTPVGAYQALLVPAFLLGLTTIVVSASIALRSRHPRLALVPPFVLLAAAIALGPASAWWPLAVGAALVFVSAVGTVVLPGGPQAGVGRSFAGAPSSRDAAPSRASASSPASASSRSSASNRASRPAISARSFRLAITRLAAIAVVIAVAAAGSTILATLLAPSSDRDVIRAHVEQPFVPRNYPSPLSGFRSYLADDQRDTTLLTVEGLPAATRLRIATVDTYTGVVYAVGDAASSSGGTSSDGTSSEQTAQNEASRNGAAQNGSSATAAGSAASNGSGIFTRVPYRLVPELGGERVTVTVRVGDYTDVWVPDVGQLEELRFHGQRADALTDTFSYNQATGTAATTAGLQPGDSYRLTAVVPTSPDNTDVAALRPGTASLPEPAALPDALTDWLEATTASADGSDGSDASATSDTSDAAATPGESLAAALDALATGGYVSHGIHDDEPTSVSGHGAARLEKLFTETPMIGDQEQYATAAALIARQLGFPARVVLGFDPGAGAASDAATEPAPGSASDPLVITGADIDAWVEVQDASGRWVTIDPTPPIRDIPERAPDEPTQISKPQTVVPPPVVQDPEQASPSTPDSEVSDPPAEQPWWMTLLWRVLVVAAWVLVIAAILVSPLLAIIAAKYARRRARRRRGEPAERIRAGWQEANDTALDYGIAIPPAATRREAATAIGGKAALTLASVADRVTFSPDRPDEDDANTVWQGVDELRRRVAGRYRRRDRLRARISLRSLRRRNR